MPHKVFSNAEFLRSLNVAPYDPEAEQAEALQREHEAIYAFHLAQARNREAWKQAWFALVFAASCFAVAWVACQI